MDSHFLPSFTTLSGFAITPSMLYTQYFRFGREFRLSVRPSGRDFYVCFRSKFRLAVQLGSVDMHRIYIYNTKDKPYILKLNGFERFPSELFTSTIVIRDFIRDEGETRARRDPSEMTVSASIVH